MSLAVSTSIAKRLTGMPMQTQANSGSRAMSVAIYMHSLAGGGAERQNLIIAEEFRRHGAEVTLVLNRIGGELLDQIPAGLRIVDLNSSRTLMDVPRLVRFLRTDKPDILLSNLDLNNVAALLAKGISLGNAKVVICQHNPVYANSVAGQSWLYRYIPLFYRVLSPLISRAVGVSDGVSAELTDIARVPAERVLTINNPVVGPDFKDTQRGIRGPSMVSRA